MAVKESKLAVSIKILKYVYFLNPKFLKQLKGIKLFGRGRRPAWWNQGVHYIGKKGSSV